jgi:hypothetical protein
MDWSPIMKTFWENISQLTQGQLFSGGYLSKEAVERLTANRQDSKTARTTKPKQKKKLPWPRLAIPH